MPTDVLVVGAHAPDLAGLRAHLGDSLSREFGGLRVTTKVVGLGLVAASAGTARGILATNPRAVVLLGTAGIFPGRGEYRPLDLITPVRVTLVCPAVVAGQANLPTPMQATHDPSPALVGALRGLRERTFAPQLASTIADVESEPVAATLGRASGCDAQNAEAFAVATACAAASVPFAALLGVTHQLGPQGRSDWARFQREAVVECANALAAWLGTGAPGLSRG